MVVEMALVLGGRDFGLIDAGGAGAADYSNTKELGRLLYTEYVYPFELAAVMLLVAMIAAIALTMRRRKGDTQVHRIRPIRSRSSAPTGSAWSI
jgi:NADH-quinone oxidoreductase subunit J